MLVGNLTKIDKQNIEDVLSLTPVQEGMLFHYLSRQNTEYYFQQLRLSLSGAICVKSLQAAWDFVVESNELLRTIFRWQQLSHPVQIVLKHYRVPITEYNFSESAPVAKNGRVEEVAANDRLQVDIEVHPLIISICKLDSSLSEMIISWHHILYDGWSNGIILKELFQAYHAVYAGAIPVKLKKGKYKEFVKWQQSQDRSWQKRFWESYLTGFKERTALPYDDRHQLKNSTAKNLILSLTPAQTSTITDFTGIHRVTLAALLYSVWGMLLQKYNNTNDVIFGTTVSGRTVGIAAVEEIVGLFINTVPLRVVTRGQECAIDLIKKIDADLKRRVDYENTSLVDIGLAAGMSGNDLFNSIVVLENYPLDRKIKQGKYLNIDSYKMSETTNYDLSLGITAFEVLELEFSYSTGCFNGDTIARMAGHCHTILRQIISNPEIKLNDIDLITVAERKQILRKFNRVMQTNSENEVIHGVFERQAAKTPDRIAIIHNGRRYSYQEINQKANRVARILRQKGVAADEPVAIVLQRSADLIIAMLGVLKTGGAYIPIDHEYSPDRISYILQDSAVKVLITQVSSPCPSGFQGVVIQIDAENLADGETSNLANINTPENLVYIIYTSGSTGNPKGVMVEHGNLLAYVKAFQDEFRLTADDVVLQQAPCSFDHFVEELYPGLLTGGTVVIADKMDVLDLKKLLALIVENRISVITCQPLLLNELNQAPQLEKVHTYLSGADVLKTEHISNLRQRGRVANTYGPTEATVCAAYYRCRPEDNLKSIPIGKPILNYRIYILNRDNQLLPIGVPGEICISGAGVARGYLNNPELTAEKFVPNPFVTGELMYRTGDLGKWLPDGNLEFLGRDDEQIKIRGFRVEPGEIEYRLLEHEAVAEAIVLPVETPDGMKHLAAYIKPRRDVRSSELREYLGKKLPDYMIPSFFYRIDRVPMTVHSKADKKALLKCKTALDHETDSERPLNATEAKIERIWREVLQLEAIGPDNNFFDIGGNSLLLMRMHAGIEKDFACETNIVDLFTHTTIAKLAKHIDGKLETIPENRLKLAEAETAMRKSAADPETEIEKCTCTQEIAIIGISVKLPMADTVAEFLNHLRMGTDCIRGIPELRQKDIDNYLKFTGKHLAVSGYGPAAYLDDIDRFDYGFFKISPREASLCDPNQRLFLQTAWNAIEDAGYGGEKLTGSRTGVYLGFGSDPDYQKMITEIEPEAISMSMPGNVRPIIASRLSYILDLKGPSLIVDTTCSSSLVAVHLACQAIRNGECDLAIAGGIQLHLIPVRDFEVGIASSTGRAKTFDDDSDGTGTGEGVIAILLKPFARARVDGDNIYAVIKSSALNQDGSSIGITAPNAKAQEDVIAEAWRKAGINPESVTYIETHGTGTKLGDPIEIEGIMRAFQKFTTKKQFCAVGLVKSNIGHLDNAAGIAGLLKAVLSLKYRELFPTLHFSRPNRRICFEESPVYVNDKLMKWECEHGKRRCGVSSFGLSGTNCHMVLEEAPPIITSSDNTSGQPEIFTLSAKSEASFRSLIKKYCEYLAVNNQSANFNDLCYTVNTGRGRYNYRLALVARDRRKLLRVLTGIADGGLRQKSPTNRYYLCLDTKAELDETKAGRDNSVESEESLNAKIQEYITAGEPGFHELCRLYAAGVGIYWEALYRNQNRNKISLPAYAFDAKRCWLNIPEPPILQRSVAFDQLYYTVVWETTPLINGPETGIRARFQGNILIFNDKRGLGEDISRKLGSAGINVIMIEPGERFLKINDNRFEITENLADYEWLLAEIGGQSVTHIIHLFSISERREIETTGELQRKLKLGIYSLFHLLTAIAKQQLSNKIEIVLIADEVNPVVRDQSGINPEHAALFGLGKVIGWELQNIRVRCIDIDGGTDTECIFKELISGAGEYQVAYRNGRRYAPRMDAIDLKGKPEKQISIKNSGVYLITGGLGGMGLQIAKSLAAKNNVNLAFINRAPLPERNQWDAILLTNEDQKQSDAIKAIREIEATGSGVVCYSADVANEKQLIGIIDQLKKDYGRINGVIHAAGIGDAILLNNLTVVDLQKMMAAKIEGTWLLDRLTRQEEPDFFVLFSSAITLVGGVGSGPYTAANSYLDAFAEWRRKWGMTLVVNWPAIENTGLSHGRMITGTDNKELFMILSVPQAMDAFYTALNHDPGRVIIGHLNRNSVIFDLEDILPFKLAEHIQRKSAATGNGKRILSTGKTNLPIETVRLKGKSTSHYTGIETKVAGIWREVLGYDELNVNDNFFEIGGDSILISRVQAIMDQQFPGRLTIGDLFSYPTIARISEYLVSLQNSIPGVPTAEDYFKNEVFALFQQLVDAEITIDEAVNAYDCLEFLDG